MDEIRLLPSGHIEITKIVDGESWRCVVDPGNLALIAQVAPGLEQRLADLGVAIDGQGPN